VPFLGNEALSKINFNASIREENKEKRRLL